MESIDSLKAVSVLILRVKFSKREYLKYISHIDMVRLFERTFRIIDIPIEYTHGYHSRPRFSIASPLPLGMEGHGEYVEIHLLKEIDIDEFISKMNEELPEDIRILDCEYSTDTKAVGHYVHWADYNISFLIEKELDRKLIIGKIEDFNNKEEVLIHKEKIKRRKAIRWEENIIPLINYFKFVDIVDNRLYINCRLKAGLGTLRPEDFIEAFAREMDLNIKKDSVRIDRLSLLGETNGEIHSIFEGERN